MAKSHTYGGNRALARHLNEAGLAIPVADVRQIARGVAAAPPAVDPTAWHCLIGENLPTALAAALVAPTVSREAAESGTCSCSAIIQVERLPSSMLSWASMWSLEAK